MTAPETKWTARDLTALLFERHKDPPTEWAVFAELRNQTGFGTRANPIRTIDVLAHRTWAGGEGAVRIAYEIKVARSDWLKELDQPGKAQPFLEQCHQFFVVSAPGIVKEAEVPEGWGWLEATTDGPGGRGLRQRVRARRREAKPLSEAFLLSLLRAASMTPKSASLWAFEGQELTEEAVLAIGKDQFNRKLEEMAATEAESKTIAYKNSLREERRELDQLQAWVDLGKWVASQIGGEHFAPYAARRYLTEALERAKVAQALGQAGEMLRALQVATHAMEALAQLAREPKEESTSEL